MSVLIRRMLGREIHCLPDQSAPDLDIAAVEKRRCNALLAKSCRFERALDAFAGVGVSSVYWSRCARELYLVEHRPAALRLLRKNLPAIARRDCEVHVVAGVVGGRGRERHARVQDLQHVALRRGVPAGATKP